VCNLSRAREKRSFLFSRVSGSSSTGNPHGDPAGEFRRVRRCMASFMKHGRASYY
jgi:hypothetical protein